MADDPDLSTASGSPAYLTADPAQLRRRSRRPCMGLPALAVRLEPGHHVAAQPSPGPAELHRWWAATVRGHALQLAHADAQQRGDFMLGQYLASVVCHHGSSA